MLKKFVCATCLLSLATFAQNPLGRIRIPGRGNNNPNPSAQQAPAGDKAPASAESKDGEIEDYLEMRAFAEGLYNQLDGSGENVRQSAFKREVDAAVEADHKRDQQLAYEMNVSGKTEVRRVEEDRYRVYSGLYDNPVVQALANRIGQSVVSPKVSQPYTFKLVADPLPRAESLSTGTVWISTGMVALMKSKAELAFVLAHEAAHIYLGHHRTRVLLELAQQEYNKQLEENGAQRRAKALKWAALAKIGGDAVGNQQLGATAAAITFGSLSSGATAAVPVVSWNRFEEDEADQLAMDWVLDSPADVEQVPKVFSKLRDLGGRDPGVTLGFLGRSDRVRERLSTIQERLDAERQKPDYKKRVIETEDPDFTLVLAEVQRDNGVAAFHYDMLETARTNLEDAVTVKTQDPTALYFYAKILLQTARTEAERNRADEFFARAASFDYRNQNYGTFLHRAIRMLTRADASPTDKKQAVALLKEYVLRYHLSKLDDGMEQQAELPPHLDSVYDYMARAGELKWTVDQKVLEEARRRRDAGSPIVNYSDVGEATRVLTTVTTETKLKPEEETPKQNAAKQNVPKPKPSPKAGQTKR